MTHRWHRPAHHLLVAIDPSPPPWQCDRHPTERAIDLCRAFAAEQSAWRKSASKGGSLQSCRPT
jgi:hypothetical protein